MKRLCPSDAVPDGDYRIVDVGRWSLVVARIAGRVHVVENMCGHQARRMDGGLLRTGAAGEACIECPHHAMQFDLRDGHIVEDAGHLGMSPLRTIASQEEGGAIWVEFPE
jgi:nitrite reductase/ring-hydroxylating ferredoxin subunit